MDMILGILIMILGGLVMLWAIACCDQMDSNMNEDGYNRINSSLGVQCNAKETCAYRFTTSCSSCVHNCGAKRDKVCYERKTQ